MVLASKLCTLLIALEIWHELNSLLHVYVPIRTNVYLLNRLELTITYTSSYDVRMKCVSSFKSERERNRDVSTHQFPWQKQNTYLLLLATRKSLDTCTCKYFNLVGKLHLSQNTTKVPKPQDIIIDHNKNLWKNFYGNEWNNSSLYFS